MIAVKLVKKLVLRIKSKLRRAWNLRKVYIFQSENDGWKKWGKPVLGGTKSEVYFDPYVLDEVSKFVMYVSYRNGGSIVRCQSDDGINWTSLQTVLDGSGLGDWEDVVNRACVLKKNGIWYMWYTGQDKTHSRIGLAVSCDGIHFKKHTGNPVLLPTGEYEGQSVMNPCVVWDKKEDIFKMWYSAGEKYEPDVICFAKSSDGIVWEKSTENPVFLPGLDEYDKVKVGGCDIVICDGKYNMFYIGYQNIDNARICRAESSDGICWKRTKNNPLLAPSKKSWDAHAVYKPSVICRGNKSYLWYNGRKGTVEAIGFATRSVDDS